MLTVEASKKSRNLQVFFEEETTYTTVEKASFPLQRIHFPNLLEHYYRGFGASPPVSELLKFDSFRKPIL